MYTRFIHASRNAAVYHENDTRGKHIKVFELLSNVDLFKAQRDAKTIDYLILNDLLIKMSEVDYTNRGCHRFKYFVSLLDTLGFKPSNEYTHKFDEEVDFLLAITKSILNFEYEEPLN